MKRKMLRNGLVVGVIFLFMGISIKPGINGNIRTIVAISGDAGFIIGTFFNNPVEEWNKTYGGPLWDIGEGIKPTADGGYILTGTKNAISYLNGGDCWLVKIDYMGDIEWEKTYGGLYGELAHDVIQTRDGGYIICGTTTSFGSGNGDVWLLKIDTNGNEIWNKTYGGTEWEWGGTVQETFDGGLIIGCATSSIGSGSLDAWLIKTDEYGEIQWSRSFGSSSYDEYFMCGIQTVDGGFIGAGRKYLDNTRNCDMFVVKTDSSGNVEWERLIGGPYPDGCLWIAQTDDGGYILTGQSSQNINQPEDLSLFKIDSFGNEEWRNYFGGPYFDTGSYVIQTPDSGFIVVGEFSFDSIETSNAVIIKTDGNGTEQYRHVFGGSRSDGLLEVHQTSDEGYIVGGYTNSYGAGNQDAWVIKFSLLDNDQPNKPSRPSGPSSGNTNEEYTYATSTIDPDVDQVYYLWDWGDGSYSQWLGPYDSGEECIVSHMWSSSGNYVIKVKAKDTNNAESEWSDPLPVSMPKTYENPLWAFIEKLFYWFEQMFERDILPGIFNF